MGRHVPLSPLAAPLRTDHPIPVRVCGVGGGGVSGFSHTAHLIIDVGLVNLMTYSQISLRIEWCSYEKLHREGVED